LLRLYREKETRPSFQGVPSGRPNAQNDAQSPQSANSVLKKSAEFRLKLKKAKAPFEKACGSKVLPAPNDNA